MKARLRAMAEREGRTESEVVRSLLETLMRTQPDGVVPKMPRERRTLRAERLYVRLEPMDRRRLIDRARAVHLPAATYIATLVRAHLGQIAPPLDEPVRLLRQEIRVLAGLAKHVAQLTEVIEASGQMPASLKSETAAMLAICTRLRDQTRALLQAHMDSWEVGYDVQKR